MSALFITPNNYYCITKVTGYVPTHLSHNLYIAVAITFLIIDYQNFIYAYYLLIKSEDS